MSETTTHPDSFEFVPLHSTDRIPLPGSGERTLLWKRITKRRAPLNTRGQEMRLLSLCNPNTQHGAWPDEQATRGCQMKGSR